VFRAATAEELACDCGVGGEGSTSVLVVGGLVMSYGCDSQGNETLDASNLATGEVVWSLPGWSFQRGDLDGPAGTHLYATSPSGTVMDLNPQTGQTEYPLRRAVHVLAVDNSRVYATCNSQNTLVCAYSTSTGGLEWQVTRGTPVALAADADGVLYLDNGQALNAATGKFIKAIWPTGYIGYNSATAIAVGDGRIAVVQDPRVLDLFGLPGY
jgi:hypothetical protein